MKCKCRCATQRSFARLFQGYIPLQKARSAFTSHRGYPSERAKRQPTLVVPARARRAGCHSCERQNYLQRADFC
jgi:hypothetical protein